MGELDGSLDAELDDATPEEKADVASELSRIQEFVSGFSLDELRSGDWFARLLTFSLGTYVKEVDAQYLRKKYPHLPPDAVVETRIKLATRYAGIEGFLSSTAYTGAVVATLGSRSGASPITVSSAIASLAADLAFTTHVQLRLAYDIAVLYGVPLNLDDPEDLWKLIRVAFLIKAGEAGRGVAAKAAPAVIRPLIKKFYSGATLSAAKSLPVIGKHLFQRTVIKGSMVGVGIPITVFMNRLSTRVAGDKARDVFRNEARIIEAARRLATRTTGVWAETLAVVWLVLLADGPATDDETTLMAWLTRFMHESDPELPALHELSSTIDTDEEGVWALLAGSTGDLSPVHAAAVVAAGIDGPVNGLEKACLAEIALRCGSGTDD
ncbi:MAG TPA: hypothetical protein PKG51_08725 [Arachnia sp.]|nr:hypothetical protein [Arachnia sp.]